MASIVMNILSNYIVFLLVLIRISCYIFISPIFGKKNIPALFKIGMSVFISYVIFESFDWNVSLDNFNIAQYMVFCAKEVIIGFILGFATSIFFSIFYISGQFIDMQVGFNLGGFFDPQLNSEVPITGNFLTVLAFLTFFQLNGHLKLIKVLYILYNDVPIEGGEIGTVIVNTLIGGFNLAFIIAVKIAIPVIVIMLITDLILGIIIKFAPQMNVFVIGIPVKMFLGLVILFFLITPLAGVLDSVFDRMIDFSNALGKNLT